jgi:hypothetical protein
LYAFVIKSNASGNALMTRFLMAEKVCSRKSLIARENQRRLAEMHPRTPEIDEKTLTVKGLLPICEPSKFVADDGEELAYLCERCRKDIGGSLEAQGTKIRPI